MESVAWDPLGPDEMAYEAKLLSDEKDNKSQEGQVFFFAARWSIWATAVTGHPVPSAAEFKAMQSVLHAHLTKHSDDFFYQLEGSDTITHHYQIYFHMKVKQRPKALAVAWNPVLYGINIQHASTAGRQYLKEYCMKPETRIAGPWGKKKIYLGADLPTTLYPWQQTIRNEVLRPCTNDRTINWLYDEKGGSGKSKFCKYMAHFHQSSKIAFGKADDIAYMVLNEPIAEVYFFDLSRTKSDFHSMNDIYASLEAVKNGDVQSNKYKVKRALFDSPHMWVMANVMPDMAKMSSDRWSVWTISQKGGFLQKMN